MESERPASAAGVLLADRVVLCATAHLNTPALCYSSPSPGVWAAVYLLSQCQPAYAFQVSGAWIGDTPQLLTITRVCACRLVGGVTKTTVIFGG